MRVIYRKMRHARYLYIKRNVEKVRGARYLSKNTVTYFMNISPVRAELFHEDGQTDMRKLCVTFRNFAKEPKNLSQ